MHMESNLLPSLSLPLPSYLGGLVRFLWHNNIVFIKFSVKLESLTAAFTIHKGPPLTICQQQSPR